jgi:hypothetical protein
MAATKGRVIGMCVLRSRWAATEEGSDEGTASWPRPPGLTRNARVQLQESQRTMAAGDCRLVRVDFVNQQTINWHLEKVVLLPRKTCQRASDQVVCDC